ncbi:magnesium chelatase [Paenibacillus swuensis]|uniref:Magnesium chelatase n=1 Tax=Paenibacillus swuensis TaxID=1178515 RepID=A0A172TJQ9_9BACL|nr:MoxR family ATPase [Paenibacillus swuensis]ANE47260.1 magnesium chelatase [Paenibacillus swuensis]
MESSYMENYAILRNIRNVLQTCILGKTDEINMMLTALLAGGHVLLEDVPGTGKTVLVKALAKSIQGQFRRIQCNPDLLPTDITGVSIYHPKQETFIFRAGPVMTNILLADEINRATTKTQSALLESMEEHSVTVDGETYELPKPFLLFATQNPIDFEGTYALPEAQLDRFMVKLSLGYPDAASELKMLQSQQQTHPLDLVKAVTDAQRVREMQEQVKSVHLDDAVADYLVAVTRRTREHPSVLLGASPRATIALFHAVKAYAYIHERTFVLPDDIKALTPYVLGHRLMLHTEARINGATVDSVLQSILEQVKVPVRLER